MTAQPGGAANSNTARTLLICLALYGAYRVVRALYTKHSKNESQKRSLLPYKKWTKREISKYRGENNMPILIAVDGRVFDVSAGRGFYGINGPYGIFAGRDASRLLATQSFDDGLTEEELGSPIDDLSDIVGEDRESLDAYIGLFSVKYVCVGDLVEEDGTGAGAAESK
ncbi:Dihydrodipicolinate synthase [Dipsacomyces acuminosporus]|nr:Dihydrodipicolinate synthase [Dipsacomyces acuminosporus]